MMPNLIDLQISLFKENDVDYVIRQMPNLKFLNNLPVERQYLNQNKVDS